MRPRLRRTNFIAPHPRHAARAFRNRTTSTVFESTDCDGEFRSLRPVVGINLIFAGRSVAFS
ncbi:hypothetical protein [Streptomyces xanthophaeus]|uniref:hypothetical protein n=1 Tax=Streptomyces xanthophaeus TaxID=67385 RepID=UPI00364729B4